MFAATPDFVFFFFNDTATTEIYTLSLHDALPISPRAPGRRPRLPAPGPARDDPLGGDRKSTRLNSSHLVISYAVFCLKKKNYARWHGAEPSPVSTSTPSSPHRPP